MDFSRLRDAIAQKLNYLNPGYLNAGSTLKTSVGFMGTFIERWLPEYFRANTLGSIFNYLPVSSMLATSGQPTESQMAAVKSAGFQRVINLAPHGLENSLPDEASLVAGLGMEYVHIPVDFKQPSETDFSVFCRAMTEAKDQKVWVHCAANMRVSAFVYRYRTQVLHEDAAVASRDLHRIWKPFGVWTDFIARSRVE